MIHNNLLKIIETQTLSLDLKRQKLLNYDSSNKKDKNSRFQEILNSINEKSEMSENLGSSNIEKENVIDNLINYLNSTHSFLSNKVRK